MDDFLPFAIENLIDFLGVSAVRRLSLVGAALGRFDGPGIACAVGIRGCGLSGTEAIAEGPEGGLDMEAVRGIFVCALQMDAFHGVRGSGIVGYLGSTPWRMWSMRSSRVRLSGEGKEKDASRSGVTAVCQTS